MDLAEVVSEICCTSDSTLTLDTAIYRNMEAELISNEILIINIIDATLDCNADRLAEMDTLATQS